MDYMSNKIMNFLKRIIFISIIGVEILIIILLYSNYSNTTYTGKFLTYPWSLKTTHSNQDPFWNLTFLFSWFNEFTESEEVFSYLFIHSDHPELIWELRQNYTSTFFNLLDNDSVGITHAYINKFGYRGREIDYLSKNNVKRILAVGDSHTFGWGVEDNQTFPFFLEKLLNENYRKEKWEVVNLGVPGYDLVQTIAMTKIKGLRYKPNVIVLQYDGDDIYPGLLKVYLDFKSESMNISNPHDLDTFHEKARVTFIRKNNITEIEKMQIVDPMHRLRELEKINNISHIILVDYYSIREDFLREKCKSFEWSYTNIYEILGEPGAFKISKYEQHLNSTAQKIVAEAILRLIDNNYYDQSS